MGFLSLLNLPSRERRGFRGPAAIARLPQAEIRVGLRSGILVFMTPAEQPGPVEYSSDGIDLTLIRWMLSLTPAERLNFAQRHINRILKIRASNDRA